MFADIPGRIRKRSRRDITRRTKTAEELLKTAMDIITDLEKFANKKKMKKDFCRRRYLIFKEGDI
jgi:hypothetical protein